MVQRSQGFSSGGIIIGSNSNRGSSVSSIDSCSFSSSNNGGSDSGGFSSVSNSNSSSSRSSSIISSNSGSTGSEINNINDHFMQAKYKTCSVL
jgi:hypothetical protein